MIDIISKLDCQAILNVHLVSKHFNNLCIKNDLYTK